MNLSKIMMTCTSDVICIVALGRKYGVETDLKELTDRLVRQLGYILHFH
ncbi:unnamed protein product, partial [Brassica oleracea]